MRYSQGNLALGMNYDLPMQAGFKFALHLTDGSGTAVAPNTGETHTVHNQVTLGREEIGIDNKYALLP